MSDSSGIKTALIAGGVAIISCGTQAIVSIVIANMGVSNQQKLENAIEKVVQEMLQSEEWTMRSLASFRSTLPGISDEDLRKSLIRLGAISVKIGDQEAWGLMARNRNLMGIGELDGPLHKKSIRVIFNGVVRTGQQDQTPRDLYRSFEWQRQLQRERQGWRGWEFDESDFIIDTLKHIVPYKLIDITINQDVIDLFFEDEIENDDYI